MPGIRGSPGEDRAPGNSEREHATRPQPTHMPQSRAKQNRADNREKETKGEEHESVSRRLRRLNG